MSSAPLILTLRFDDASFRRFDGMRRQHFPPERNHIPAHLTLFHHLPGESEADVTATLREATREREPLPLRVTSLRFLGYGCAYEIDCPPLVTLRKELADGWRDTLTPQDASGFRPHVTIQNKVASAEAKRTFAALQAAFEPFDARGIGLLLWRYRGGPWDAAGEFPFRVPA
ncbi:2'-5' RNA ligase family protein [Aureimonas leprariae]|uniref:2'-5' RNA ligase family protein n=1 Tax=Plantimonas leprariae TaxID=2615207 RepID=A0A7V7PQR6_9HYPH|nr:2'-5' RNA ligase family protein [Aureimonas leprariae]KAB0680699.1 2'-5' RNA ligase family protein [Aureimonas leprariae]